MALKKLSYKRLQHLVGIHLSTKESPTTQILIHELSSSKKRGYLAKLELIKVCRWKSPRAIRHIQRNRAKTVVNVTRAAFATRNEQKKLLLLTDLYGVSVPMASSILMLTNPKRYGVIDIRVWQLLFKMGSVNTNKKGVRFNFNEWYRYLMIIRYFARMYKVGARDIERTLFGVHELYQKGTLYNN